MNESILRPPLPRDGAAVWRLVRASGSLEPNSSYAYLLFLDRFRDTCLLCEADEELLGFVLAFRPPRRPEAVFVWQIGVAATARGRGLGGRLLEGLVDLEGCRGVSWLEATVTPSNRASRSLFRSFARRISAEVTVSPCYGPELFPDLGHEPEELYRIGPFERARRRDPRRNT